MQADVPEELHLFQERDCAREDDKVFWEGEGEGGSREEEK